MNTAQSKVLVLERGTSAVCRATELPKVGDHWKFKYLGSVVNSEANLEMICMKGDNREGKLHVH